jgi:hypothetical protein
MGIRPYPAFGTITLLVLLLALLVLLLVLLSVHSLLSFWNIYELVYIPCLLQQVRNFFFGVVLDSWSLLWFFIRD